MHNARQKAFVAKLPDFTEQQAKNAFEQFGGEIVSVQARRGTPDYVLVAFATDNRQFGPIALNPVVVDELLNLLSRLRFQ